MVETPLVTVLLPFYQAHRTLDRAVRSIAQQTFSGWQLILVDNNADAESKTIASHWTQRDNRVRVIYEPQQGIAHALNTGLRNVQTKYIARMDADDESLPERLQKQVDFLELNQEIGLVSCRCRFVSTSEQAEGYKQFVDWQNNILTPTEHAVNRFVESPLAHPSVMFRNGLVEKFGGYTTSNLPEDYELWLRWMERGVLFQKLEDELLVWHDSPQRLSRVHPNYSQDAFFETKMAYLARWIQSNIPADRRITVCGTGKAARDRSALLESHGIGKPLFTDVRRRGVDPQRFVPAADVGRNRALFFINFISSREVRVRIEALFREKGLMAGKDFILAA